MMMMMMRGTIADKGRRVWWMKSLLTPGQATSLQPTSHLGYIYFTIEPLINVPCPLFFFFPWWRRQRPWSATVPHFTGERDDLDRDRDASGQRVGSTSDLYFTIWTVPPAKLVSLFWLRPPRSCEARPRKTQSSSVIPQKKDRFVFDSPCFSCIEPHVPLDSGRSALY